MPTLSLYASAFDAVRDEWTKVGASPYLGVQDEPINYVYSIVKRAECGDFGFVDSGKSTETINSVALYVYGQQVGVLEPYFYLWDGSAWTDISMPDLPASWGWQNVDVSLILGTWAKIDSAKLYLAAKNSTNRIDVDAAYLYVDYSEVTVGWKRLDYASEPPTPNAWNQLKRETGSGWKKLLFEGE